MEAEIPAAVAKSAKSDWVKFAEDLDRKISMAAGNGEWMAVAALMRIKGQMIGCLVND